MRRQRRRLVSSFIKHKLASQTPPFPRLTQKYSARVEVGKIKSGLLPRLQRLRRVWVFVYLGRRLRYAQPLPQAKGFLAFSQRKTLGQSIQLTANVF